jgi:hypothetical protein
MAGEVDRDNRESLIGDRSGQLSHLSGPSTPAVYE